MSIDGVTPTMPAPPARPPAPGASCRTATSRSGCGYGNGFSSTPSTTLNTAVVAPIPIASVSSATSVNSGLRRRPRTAWRASRASESITPAVVIDTLLASASIRAQRDHRIRVAGTARGQPTREERGDCKREHSRRKHGRIESTYGADLRRERAADRRGTDEADRAAERDQLAALR